MLLCSEMQAASATLHTSPSWSPTMSRLAHVFAQCCRHFGFASLGCCGLRVSFQHLHSHNHKAALVLEFLGLCLGTLCSSLCALQR